MSLLQLIRLLLKYKVWIISIPLLVAVTIYLLSHNLSRQYESKAVVFTNPNSNQGATDGGVGRVDFYTSNNLFDNLMLLMKSRETLNDAAIKLLALHLSLEQAVPSIITPESFNELTKHVSPALKQELSVIGDPEKTYENLIRYHQENPDSVIDYLVREHPHYGFQDILDNLFAARKSSSDMMEVVYKSDDPGVCYYTLQFILDSFMENYEEMKEQENITSIRYFQEQLKTAQDRLMASELNLKEFISANQILNYYEQGKYLDIAKLEQDQDEERAKRLASGTRANLDQIEGIFSGFESRKSAMDTLAALRKELTEKQMELDGLRILGSNHDSLKAYSKNIETIQGELENNTNALFESALSPQGVPRKSILDEWLRLKVQYEEQVQSIEIMQNRKEFINDKINEFAPLGAELKRLEREVSVNENQYLSILNGLNVANLRKYDLEMTSSQKLIDEPIFPKKPLPSKRKFLVAGGFLGSGFIVVSFALLLFFVDPSIKTAERAASFTNTPIAGGWIDERKIAQNINKPLLFKRLINQLLNYITGMVGAKDKMLIALVSIREGEGKSFLADKLLNELSLQGAPPSFISSEEGTRRHSSNTVSATSAAGSAEVSQPILYEDLIKNAKGKIVVIELSSIQQSPINFEVMNQADLNILVVDSKRNWTLSDKLHLENLQKGLNKPQVVWLNKMDEEALEDLNGEVPKDRSKIRTYLKSRLS